MGSQKIRLSPLVAKAQYNVGMAYHSGDGVKKDDVEAYFWINIAASFLEQPSIKQSRENIGKLLSAEQLSEVQERCRKWVEMHPNAEK
jgi:Sel1 repeat